MKNGRLCCVLSTGWGNIISGRLYRFLAAVVLCLVVASTGIHPASAIDVVVNHRDIVVLQWTPSPYIDVSGYRVFRTTTTGGPYTELTSSLLGETRFLDKTVQDGEIYFYVVTVSDFAGNQSVPTPEYESFPVLVMLKASGVGSIDTDLDGLTDDNEIVLGTDPFLADTDGDELDDYDEIVLGTDPLYHDTDNDGLNDYDEIGYGTDPLFHDTDNDGLDDGDETALGTDPLVADSDNDGLDDGDEVFVHGTDPLASDSDLDGIDDGTEILEGTDPMDVRDIHERCDVNRDGLFDAVDVQMIIIQVIMGTTETVEQFDIDRDGYVGAVDIQLVINAALGFTT